MKKIEEMKIESNNARRGITEQIENGARSRWDKKPVLKYKTIFSPSDEILKELTLNQFGKFSINTEFSKLGKSTLQIDVNTEIEGKGIRPACGFTYKCDSLDLSEYNRISVWMYVKASGYDGVYTHFFCSNAGEADSHTENVPTNKWVKVSWEINQYKRDNVKTIKVIPFIWGCPDEALSDMTIYVDEMRAEKVEAEFEKGWSLDERIAFSHVGYLINAQKIALTGICKDNKFTIQNDQSEVVFRGIAKKINSTIGDFYELDFSKLTKSGIYTIKVDSRVTKEFAISYNPYEMSIWKSLNFLKSLRCGEDVAGVHSACHLNCKSRHPITKETVPNFGGWHDAGDVSQFERCTAEMAQSILELGLKCKDTNRDLSERCFEEARVGISWCLRTRFGDGYRANSVTYRIWNHSKTVEGQEYIITNDADNGPFENFQASAAEAVAYRVYKDYDPNYATWCLRSAKEDFEFAKAGYTQGIYTKRWGPNIDSLVSGHGSIAASELYKATGDSYYLEEGSKYCDIILACQEQDNPKWEKPIRGFFYDNTDHKTILTFEHRGHENSPIQGLVKMCEVAPTHPDFSKWIAGVTLYKEYILKTMYVSYPYNLLPAHIYDINKLNLDSFTIPSYFCTKEVGLQDLCNQIKQGEKLDKDVYLRRLPCAVQRRGFLATSLAKTKAVSSIATLLKDDELKQIALDQIEWMFGKNPFTSSIMYGEGYNYHPLYVAFSKQIVGALPVGIMTMGDRDEPYWPTFNNAVFKEIWGHTTGKYLWVLEDLV